MSVIDFNKLSDESRLWIFGSSRPFNKEESGFIKNAMQEFARQWVSHENEVTSGWDLRYDRFFLIGANEAFTGLSGCSIDSMMDKLRYIERELDTGIANTNANIFFRNADTMIQCVSREEFRRLAERSAVNEDTIVFDNTIQEIAELRQGKWEIPMKESWHMKAFGTAVQL